MRGNGNTDEDTVRGTLARTLLTGEIAKGLHCFLIGSQSENKPPLEAAASNAVIAFAVAGVVQDGQHTMLQLREPTPQGLQDLRKVLV